MIEIVKNIKAANAVTHSGSIHADEVFATVFLEKYLKNLKVCRVKEEDAFKAPKRAIVYDVGKGEFDHHQKGGNGTRLNGVPYATCGLIWKKFGREILKTYIEPQYINDVWRTIEKKLVSGIDAVDNVAVPKVDYPANPMSVSTVIASFNPTWDSEEDFDEAFLEAVDFAKIIFEKLLKNAYGKAKAKIIINEKINDAKDGIMILDKYLPWDNAVFTSQNPKAEEILFVVYPSNRGGYCWQGILKAYGTSELRKKVPTEWYGLNDDELRRVTGVETATFCHKDGFIGGAKTIEDAIILAKKAIEA